MRTLVHVAHLKECTDRSSRGSKRRATHFAGLLRLHIYIYTRRKEKNPIWMFCVNIIELATSVWILTSFFPSFHSTHTLAHVWCGTRVCVRRGGRAYVCCVCLTICLFFSLYFNLWLRYPPALLLTFVFSMTSSLRSRFSTSILFGHISLLRTNVPWRMANVFLTLCNACDNSALQWCLCRRPITIYLLQIQHWIRTFLIKSILIWLMIGHGCSIICQRSAQSRSHFELIQYSMEMPNNWNLITLFMHWWHLTLNLHVQSLLFMRGIIKTNGLTSALMVVKVSLVSYLNKWQFEFR